MAEINYQSGFLNEFESECLKGALPERGNTPKNPPYGLYAEQLSGSAFTAKPADNRRSWFYRIRPSVVHGAYKPYEQKNYISATDPNLPQTPPDQLRWNPIPVPSQPTDFVDGLVTFAVNGDPASRTGASIHQYFCNKSMTDKCFYNADAELLIVPQLGVLTLKTEMGLLEVSPNEIALMPRGLKFSVLVEGDSRGYICENYGEPFVIPHRGPIGANGMANPRDFKYPVARYEDENKNYTVVARFLGGNFYYEQEHSPFDVVAWHGNFAPCKYDLAKYNTMGTISFDHPDPSIFTVLTSPSLKEGTANVDFVVFPPRWLVGEETFRPPYYHRNIMSEFMGLISGEYDAKPGKGFAPGGCSVHNIMSAHGPDSEAFEKGSSQSEAPQKIDNTMAFMFETGLPMKLTHYALNTDALQSNYRECWQGLKSNFQG